nr:hypothetical protein [Cressdnaviricota sp.]
MNNKRPAQPSSSARPLKMPRVSTVQRKPPRSNLDPISIWLEQERDAWETIAKANERDLIKKELQNEVLERVNRTHIRNLQDATETITHLWRRHDILFATLSEIGHANPDIADRYMPWLNAPTPPGSPDEIDLTADEELEDIV